MVRKSNKAFTDILKEHHKMIKGLEEFEMKQELNRIADLDMMMKVEHELKQCMIAILISFRYHYIIDKGIQNLSFSELNFYIENFIRPHPKYENNLISIIDIKYDVNNNYRHIYNTELDGENKYKLNVKLHNKLTEYELIKYTTMIYNKYDIHIDNRLEIISNINI
jgi:hypothetical protein